MSAGPGDPAPHFRVHVFCCTNRRPGGHARGCCAAKGAARLRGYLKARAKELGLADVRINAAGCLDRCELGPTMVIYPEGVWYGYESAADLEEILDTHIMAGGRVPRLMLAGGPDGPDGPGGPGDPGGEAVESRGEEGGLAAAAAAQ